MDKIYKKLLNDKFVVIDDFFPKELSLKLRDIALNLRDVDDIYPDYYSINYYNPIYEVNCKLSEDDCSLITTEIPSYLKKCFPFLSENEMDFQRGWYFVHDNNQFHSVKKHVDYDAYFTINLWVTPDENRQGITNEYDGFVIYGNGVPTVIPYKFNRMTIFFSQTFHESQLCRFKQGDTMKKINYTFLFGKNINKILNP